MTFVFFFTALFSLASSPIWVRWAHSPIELICFWRLFFSAVLVMIWLISRRQISGAFLFLNRPHWKWPLFSGFFFFLHLWTYVAAAQNTSVAHLMILFSTNPIFTTLGASWIFKEKAKKRLFLAYPFAFGGICLLALEKTSAPLSSHYGDLMALASAALHAAYLLCSKRARKHFQNAPFSLGLYSSSALLFLALALIRGVPLMNVTTEGWQGIAGLILFPTFLGHFLMTWLVAHINLSLLSFGKLLEPGMASAMAFFLYHEQVTPMSTVAFLLTAGSVLILFWPARWIWKI